jgi:hypothetical protein
VLHATTTYVIAAVTSLAVLASPASGGGPHDQSTSSSRAPGTTVSAPAAALSPVPARRCGAEPSTAAGWQHLFDGLSGDWAGADGTSSTRLPDGRLLWVFGDTLVGKVGADGVRAPGTRMVRNSMLVTEGTCVTTVPTTADALPGRDGSWLWPTHSVVLHPGSASDPTVLAVFASRLTRSGAGLGGFRRVGDVVVTLRVAWHGAPKVDAVRDLPASDVLWGAALLRDDATTWIYGTREVHAPLVFGRDLLLARAPTATADDPATWTYRTATGWSSRRSAAVVLRPGRLGVSTVPSVARAGRAYVIVTKPQEFLDDRVVALSSAHPWGPWTERVIATAPSTDALPRYSPVIVAAQHLSSRHLVIVVNQTASTLEAIMRRAADTRPVFLDARLS